MQSNAKPFDIATWGRARTPRVNARFATGSTVASRVRPRFGRSTPNRSDLERLQRSYFPPPLTQRALRDAGL